MNLEITKNDLGQKVFSVKYLDHLDVNNSSIVTDDDHRSNMLQQCNR